MCRRLGLLLIAFVTVATVSCSSAPPAASTTPTAAPTSGTSGTAAPTTGTAPTAAPTTGTAPTRVTLEPASAATKTIGSDGGTITAGNLALTIPAGALTKQVAITVTPLSGIGGTPLDDGFLGGAQLEPDGLRFLKPAILSMPLPAGTTAANVVGFGYAGQGASFHLSPHETAGSTIKLVLWHFSGGGAATADAAAVAQIASFPFPLSQAGMQAEQDFAAANFTLQQALANGVDQNTALAAFLAAGRAAIDRWYTNGIRPALLAAGDGSFQQFGDTFGEFIEWTSYILGGFGGPGSAPQRAEGKQLANTAAAAQANRLLDLCGAGDLSGPLGPLTELTALAVGGSVSLGPAGLPADLISACAHPKIEVVDFPAVAALGGPNTLRGRVTVDVHNGPDRTDLPTTITVGGSPVAVDASGNFQTTVTPTANPLNTLIIAQVTSFGGSSVQLQRPVRERIELEALAPINALHPGDSVTLVVRVAGDGMSNGTVHYSLSGVGQLSTASGTTNADGEVPDFDYSVSADSPPGTGTVTASFQGATDSITAVALAASSVAAASLHTCARLVDSTVKCWGINVTGLLGNGTFTDSSTPVFVSGISTAVAVSSGSGHSCALLADSTLNCWGLNINGQLGDGSATDSTTPVLVSGITSATAVSAGRNHTCARLSDSTLKCWGLNTDGQLGNGTNADSSTPFSVRGITNATAVSAGYGHTCAVFSDGTLKCWGKDNSGQLGNGTNTDSATPVSVSGITNATAVSAGGGSRGAHSCALLLDATLRCWGANGNGQLGGNGLDCGGSCSYTPISVTAITNGTAVSAGGAHTCAQLTDGTLSCWGSNSFGQLGNGTDGDGLDGDDSSTPVRVSGIP